MFKGKEIIIALLKLEIDLPVALAGKHSVSNLSDDILCARSVNNLLF